jgi:glycosyltransferase involved in cell wall biosynthesis
MKILVCTGIFPPEIGGPATYAGLLANELPKRGFNVEVLPFREVRGYPRIIRHFVYFLKILSKGGSADVIFTQDPVSTGVPVICAAFLLRKKVVLRVAGDYAWEQASQRFGVIDSIDEFQKKDYSFSVELLRMLQTFSVRFADTVITPSNYFNNLVSGWTKKRCTPVVTIYNGIDLKEDFKKDSKFSEKTIISAGRLVPWKGFDTLIEAIGRMPEWRLLIAGDGPDKERLTDLVSKNNVNDRVTFLGKLERQELFSQIHSSHIFALLSTFESFSFQIVEAMHIGTPVIAANIGNLSEIVDSGSNGVLISPKDIDAFIENAKKFIEDDLYREKVIEAAKQRAKDFSVEKTLDKLAEVFRDLSGKI